jgi:hypothetical protein
VNGHLQPTRAEPWLRIAGVWISPAWLVDVPWHTGCILLRRGQQADATNEWEERHVQGDD